MKNAVIKITGMHCSSCAMRIGESLKENGVKAKVDVLKGRADIAYDDKKINLNRIIQIVKDEGYGASI